MTTLDEIEARLAAATRLLEWWLATNPPDDRGTRLAQDTGVFLVQLRETLRATEHLLVRPSGDVGGRGG